MEIYMSLKERLLKKEFSFSRENAESLALWIRENEQDLRDVLEHNVPVRKIQVEAITDLGDKFPNDVNFEAALYFSLLQLEAVRKEQSNIVNIPVVNTVEDLNKIEQEKKARKRAEKVVEPDNTEPYMVGNKKYYYVKFKINKKEVKTVRLSSNIKSVRQFLYDKKYRESQVRGYEVPFEIIDIRYAEKDELVKMGIIDAGTDK